MQSIVQLIQLFNMKFRCFYNTEVWRWLDICLLYGADFFEQNYQCCPFNKYNVRTCNIAKLKYIAVYIDYNHYQFIYVCLTNKIMFSESSWLNLSVFLVTFPDGFR